MGTYSGALRGTEESVRQGNWSIISAFWVPLGWVLSDNFRVDHFPCRSLSYISSEVLQPAQLGPAAGLCHL